MRDNERKMVRESEIVDLFARCNGSYVTVACDSDYRGRNDGTCSIEHVLQKMFYVEDQSLVFCDDATCTTEHVLRGPRANQIIFTLRDTNTHAHTHTHTHAHTHTHTHAHTHTYIINRRSEPSVPRRRNIFCRGHMRTNNVSAFHGAITRISDSIRASPERNRHSCRMRPWL